MTALWSFLFVCLSLLAFTFFLESPLGNWRTMIVVALVCHGVAAVWGIRERPRLRRDDFASVLRPFVVVCLSLVVFTLFLADTPLGNWAVLVAVALTGGAVAMASGLWEWPRLRRRRQEVAAWALREELRFCSEDTVGLHECGFPLFRLGEQRGWDNVVSGEWRGHEVRVADYWFDEKGTSTAFTRARRRLSVVVVRIDTELPVAAIDKRSMISWVEEHMVPMRLSFESEAFNRAFMVHADDREFAFKLLDARMIDWLLRTEDDHGYQVGGHWLLAYAPPVPPDRLSMLLFAATGFIDRIPRLVWADYGSDT